MRGRHRPLASIWRDNGAPRAGPGSPGRRSRGNTAGLESISLSAVSAPSHRRSSTAPRRTRPRRQERGRGPQRRRGRENLRRKRNGPVGPRPSSPQARCGTGDTEPFSLGSLVPYRKFSWNEASLLGGILPGLSPPRGRCTAVSCERCQRAQTKEAPEPNP